MIFVTVGTQLPFDRLIMTVDEWAASRKVAGVVAQIGPSAYKPSAIEAYGSITPARFNEYQRDASVLVSHAGMGAILSALETGKPLVIMPRRSALGEHRNDHQLATVAKFRGTQGIYVAENKQDLYNLLDGHDTLISCSRISGEAPQELIDALRAYISREMAGHGKKA